MAKKSEVGTLFFKPAKGITVPGKKEGQVVCLGTFIITDGLAKDIFGEEEESGDNNIEDSVTISGRGITVKQ